MDLEGIIDWIEQEKAVLVLGPDIMYQNGEMLLKEFSNFLTDKKVKHTFNDDEELFSSATKFKPFVFQQLPKFFEALQATEMHEKIAEIPFHLIISLSPDTLLKQTFEAKGFDKEFAYYHKDISSTAVSKPSKEKPLLYNLLGIRTEYNSLVISFNHLFDYLASVLGDKKLPENLRTELSEAQTFFFLGFKYDKWYFKLIMRLLNQDDEVLRQASLKDVEAHEGLISFYTDEFSFNFIEEASGTEIINQLHAYFSEKGTLRKPAPEAVPVGNTITNIINVSGDRNIVVQDNTGNININKA